MVPVEFRGRRRGGSTLPIVALSMSALIGMGALAIEVGKLYAVRAQAGQRADAAALAAASAFGQGQSGVVARATALATEFAGYNPVSYFTPEDSIRVVADSSLVDVTVTVNAQTTLARVLGRNSVVVSARARAAMRSSGSVPCLRPFAIPDRWGGMTRNSVHTTEPYATGVTSWGTTYLDPQADFGLLLDTMELAGSGETNVKIPYGKFVKLDIPLANPLDCVTNVYRMNGGTIPSASNQGNPTALLIQEIIEDDPNLRWENGQLVGSKYGDWRASPRVSPAAIFHPDSIPLKTGNNPSYVRPVGFIGLFWQEQFGSGANQRYLVRLIHVRGVADDCENDPDIECAPGLGVVRLMR